MPPLSVGIGIPRSMVVDKGGNVYIAAEVPSGGQEAGRVFKVDPTGTLTVFAGGGPRMLSRSNGDGEAARLAELKAPSGLALDRSGNLFVADEGGGRVRRIDAVTGIITTAAGTRPPGEQMPGGPAVVGSLLRPAGVAVDGAGNLYIVDRGAQRLLRLDAQTGSLDTLAGGDFPGDSGDGGPALKARLSSPLGVAVDSAGNVYIADKGNHRIRKISADGTISTLAGNGKAGFSGDGGPATAASLKDPSGVALDAMGGLLIADAGNGRVRRVTTSGVISTLLGGVSDRFSGDGGPSAKAGLGAPVAVALAPAGALLIADARHRRIRKVDPSGIISTLAGNGGVGYCGDGGPAKGALLQYPSGLAFCGAQCLYVAERGQHRIRKIDLETGLISTVAGNGFPGFDGDGGPATDASVQGPEDIAVDRSGNLLIADTRNNRIRRVSPSGIITTIAGCGGECADREDGHALGTRFSGPDALAIDGRGNLFVADELNHRVLRIELQTGLVTPVAGTGWRPTDPEDAFMQPMSLAFDPAGNLFIATKGNPRIRRLDAANMNITTVAVRGSYQGFPGVAMRLATDRQGGLFVAASQGQRVWRLDLTTGLASPVAGDGTLGGRARGDGVPALTTHVWPEGVAVGPSGDLFISDTSGRVRRLDAQGVISTVAGGGSGF
jgi:DNA-binding beta-propeller fold protein YncE